MEVFRNLFWWSRGQEEYHQKELQLLSTIVDKLDTLLESQREYGTLLMDILDKDDHIVELLAKNCEHIARNFRLLQTAELQEDFPSCQEEKVKSRKPGKKWFQFGRKQRKVQEEKTQKTQKTKKKEKAKART